MLTTDLVLVTYPPDYEWLQFLFRSLPRMTGWRDLLVIIEEGDEVPPLPAGARLIRCQRYRGSNMPAPARGPGHLGQQIEKMGSWRHTDAERILWLDSDIVVCRPVDIQSDESISLERPWVYPCRWDHAGACAVHRAGTAALLGFDAPGETMCRHPFVLPRWLVEECWHAVGGQQGIMGAPETSEFNVLMSYAMVRHPEAVRVAWHEHETLRDPVTWEVIGEMLPKCMAQFYSKAGVAESMNTIKEFGLDVDLGESN